MLQSASASASAPRRARLAQRQPQQPRPRPAPSSSAAPPPPQVPRRVVAARRLLTALSNDAYDDLELRPYLWRCGRGGGGAQGPTPAPPPLPSPPPAWRHLERLVASASKPGHLPPRELLPLLAAPPSALLPERAVLRHAAAAGAGAEATTTTSRRPCQLSRRGLLSPLRDRELEEFLARLFEAAVVGRRRRRRGWEEEEGAGAGAAPPPPPPPPIELSRHDLFHAHLFASSSSPPSEALSLGLLFHAAEYPRQTRAEEEEEEERQGDGRGAADPNASSFFRFPYDLGKCQRDSELEATREVLDWRSLLYFEGELASFCVAQGGPLRPLLRPGTAPLRTVYEEDLALVAAGDGGQGGWVGPDVLCFHARDVVGEGRGLWFAGGGWGGGRGGGSGHLRLPPIPEPVETSLGPLHVFLSY